jgi:hypothetical protein
MYDGMTGHYTFACPVTGEVSLPLSAFRVIDRLPGAAHPAVYKITFSCECRDEHEGLVAHDDLDWAPLAGGDVSFVNMMTSKLESAAADLLELAATQIRVGEWPWSFFCYPEERARPVFPSSFRALGAGEDRIGLAVQCPSCSRTSVNLVTHRHVDVPLLQRPKSGRRRAHLLGRPRDNARGVPLRTRLRAFRRPPPRPRRVTEARLETLLQGENLPGNRRRRGDESGTFP